MTPHRFRAYVHEDLPCRLVRLYLIGDVRPGVCAFVGEDGKVEEYEEGSSFDAMKPLWQISRQVFSPEEILESIRKAIAKWQGAKEEQPLGGRLEATERHLKDVRHLLKLPSLEDM